MATWQTIYGLDEPVKGSLSEFGAARTSFGQMRDDSNVILEAFSTFLDQGQYAGKMEGDTAVMFAQMLTELDNGIDDLPRVAGEAYDVFDAHIGSTAQANTLAWLIDEADSALARATVAHEELATLVPQRTSLQGQISQLDLDIEDPANEDRKDELEQQRTDRQGDLGAVDGDISTNEGILETERETWTTLQSSEETLNENTGDAIDSIDLGDLEDPGFWDKLVDFAVSIGEWAVDFVANIYENLVLLVEALADGRFLDALWAIKGLLDAALLILGTIALFTGIGAPLFFLAVAAFAVTTALAVTQHPNPQTGQVLGVQDVLWSAAGVAMSSAGFMRNIGGPNGFRLFTQTTMRGRNATGYASVLSGTRAAGGLRTMQNNMRSLSRMRVAPRTSTREILSLNSRTHTWPSTVAGQRALYARAGLRATWGSRSTVGGVYTGLAPVTSQFDNTSNGADDVVGDVFESKVFGGTNGDRYTGNTEPDNQGARRIVLQARNNPAVQIVPMP